MKLIMNAKLGVGSTVMSFNHPGSEPVCIANKIVQRVDQQKKSLKWLKYKKEGSSKKEIETIWVVF